MPRKKKTENLQEDKPIEIAFQISGKGRRWFYSILKIQNGIVIDKQDSQYNALPYVIGRLTQVIKREVSFLKGGRDKSLKK